MFTNKEIKEKSNILKSKIDEIDMENRRKNSL